MTTDVAYVKKATVTTHRKWQSLWNITILVRVFKFISSFRIKRRWRRCCSPDFSFPMDGWLSRRKLEKSTNDNDDGEGYENATRVCPQFMILLVQLDTTESCHPPFGNYYYFSLSNHFCFSLRPITSWKLKLKLLEKCWPISWAIR